MSMGDLGYPNTNVECGGKRAVKEKRSEIKEKI